MGGHKRDHRAGFVLAIEPDPRQAPILRRVVQDQVRAELLLVDSKDAAVSALATRIPDVILLTTLLAPRDEDELTGHLKTLDRASHVQTLTIPLLGAPREQEPLRNRMFGALSRKRRTGATDGCDPAVFGEQVQEYLKRARDLRAERESEETLETLESTDGAEAIGSVPALDAAAAQGYPIADAPRASDTDAPEAVAARADDDTDAAARPRPWGDQAPAAKALLPLASMLANAVPPAFTIGAGPGEGWLPPTAQGTFRDSRKGAHAGHDRRDGVTSCDRAADDARLQDAVSIEPFGADTAVWDDLFRSIEEKFNETASHPMKPVILPATGDGEIEGRAAQSKKSRRRTRTGPTTTRISHTAPADGVQDEWGFYDPDRCGIAALMARLK